MPRLYKRPGSPYYYIDYVVDGKRVRRSLGVTDRKLAELKLKEIEVELAKGKLGFQKSVDKWEFFNHYIEWCKVNKSAETARKDERVLKDFFEWLPISKLDKITSRHIESYKNYLVLHRKLKKITVNIHLRHLKAAFNYAVKWKYLQSNPVENVKPFPIPEKGRMRVLREEEEEKLLQVLPEELRIIVRVLLYTGMRRGEFANLEWDDVDLDGGFIQITNKAHWHTKTMRTRKVPIPDFLKEDLMRLKEISPEKPFRYCADYLTKKLRKACEEARIDYITVHDLRHTFASRLAMKGVSLYTISKLLGHQEVSTTQIYAKFLPDSLKNVVNTVFGTNLAQKNSDS